MQFETLRTEKTDGVVTLTLSRPERFNAFNVANLTGHNGDVTRPAFGQATSRSIQSFGSGGPRAFQLAMRVTF